MTTPTSAEIRAALKLRYAANSHALLFEVADSTGAQAKRFADAVAIGLWPSHGHEIEGIEIKVSRADFLREKADHSKSQAVFQYCNRWWLATPKGLVTPDELPSTWGLLECVGDTMRVKVKAPKLEPAAPSIGFLASMLRRHAGMDEETCAITLRRQTEKIQQYEHERAQQNARQEYDRKVEQARAGLEKLEEIKVATGIDLTTYTPADEWIAAIRFACAGYRRFGAPALLQLRQQLLAFAKEIAVYHVGDIEEPEETHG